MGQENKIIFWNKAMVFQKNKINNPLREKEPLDIFKMHYLMMKANRML